ncbi:MAG: hypothetical protein ABS36_11165 [Acidobacteria bacterium SCN 69-37]|nr:MAG: hypothetical protein ABS36_11165 [Acidobacteria bacterium SCN 69-37]
MRIAFDLDGVLADLHTPFVRAAIRLFPDLEASVVESGDPAGETPGDEADDDDVPPVLPGVNLTSRQSAAVWRHLAGTEDFWEGLDEIEPGAIARLAALADERRWEILFITSRPTSVGRTVQRQTQRWLQDRGFPLPSVYVVHGSRGRIADALAIDVVIDDRADNCLDVVLESRAGALLVWRGALTSVPASTKRLGIAVVPTVARVLEALVEAERAADGGDLLDRLRRLFGLKPRASSPLVRS